MRSWHSLNCIVQNRDAEAAEMTARLKRSISNRMRHPLGTGIPGPHNWSGTDETTILREPMGSTPSAVNWSISIVLTPGGFVGRIDNYVKGITQHLEVEPNVTTLYQEMRELAAHSPFRQEVSSAGSSELDLETDEFQEEELEAEFEEDGNAAGRDDDANVYAALRALVEEFDPSRWTLAEICEEYGLDWQFERDKQRNQPTLWR